MSSCRFDFRINDQNDPEIVVFLKGLPKGERGVWLREAVRLRFSSGEIRSVVPVATVAAPLPGLPAAPVPLDLPVDGDGGSVDERFDRLAGKF